MWATFRAMRCMFLRAPCRGSIECHSGGPKNDWELITYGHNLVHHRGELWPSRTTLRGRVATFQKSVMENHHVIQLVKHFTIASEKGVWHCAAIVSITPDYPRYAQHPMDVCSVTRKPGDFLNVLPVGRIIRPTNMIPTGGSNSLAMTCLIKSYIDLTIWNTVTNDIRQAADRQETAGKRRQRG